MPHNPYASFASPMDSQDSKDTLFDLESHPSYETPSLLSGGRKGLQRKTSSPPQPPSSLTASYMPFTNDRVWSNSYGSSSLNGGESFLSHPNAHNLLRVPQQQQHFHQGKSAQQSVNNSLRMSSSVQSSSLLLSASYQSEQSFTENLASSSSLKMQSFVVSGRDSIPVLAEDDVEQHKKLVDEITEDVEDGCPVVKVPRRMYNGLSGRCSTFPVCSHTNANIDRHYDASKETVEETMSVRD